MIVDEGRRRSMDTAWVARVIVGLRLNSRHNVPHGHRTSETTETKYYCREPTGRLSSVAGVARRMPQ